MTNQATQPPRSATAGSHPSSVWLNRSAARERRDWENAVGIRALRAKEGSHLVPKDAASAGNSGRGLGHGTRLSRVVTVGRRCTAPRVMPRAWVLGALSPIAR